MLYHAKEERIIVGGSRMDYVSFGCGEKVMLIIPGLNLRDVKGSALPLAYMYRLFAKEYKVYVFDRKRDIPEGYTTEDIAEDIWEAMKLLNLEKAYVFGVSQGGMAALYLALNHPERVEKLVLGVTASRVNPQMEQVVRSWITMAEQGNFRGIIEDMPDKMYSEAYCRKYRGLFPLLSLLGKPKDGQRFVRLAKACLTVDVYERLGQISCPVLILGGKEDKIVTAAASVEMAEKLDCELYLYENLGHAAYEEAADFNQRILDFWRKG